MKAVGKCIIIPLDLLLLWIANCTGGKMAVPKRKCCLFAAVEVFPVFHLLGTEPNYGII